MELVKYHIFILIPPKLYHIINKGFYIRIPIHLQLYYPFHSDLM
nr:MAG TPA: hypothetical protein [Caudoviricetes sp.]